ncbi:transporter, partial [Vibrio sp. 2094]|nr:transporter [Vibrio sp. 2094]
TEHGPFKTAADLTNVKGIGEATIKKSENRILL